MSVSKFGYFVLGCPRRHISPRSPIPREPSEALLRMRLILFTLVLWWSTVHGLVHFAPTTRCALRALPIARSTFVIARAEVLVAMSLGRDTIENQDYCPSPRGHGELIGLQAPMSSMNPGTGLGYSFVEGVTDYPNNFGIFFEERDTKGFGFLVPADSMGMDCFVPLLGGTPETLRLDHQTLSGVEPLALPGTMTVMASATQNGEGTHTRTPGGTYFGTAVFTGACHTTTPFGALPGADFGAEYGVEKAIPCVSSSVSSSSYPGATLKAPGTARGYPIPEVPLVNPVGRPVPEALQSAVCVCGSVGAMALTAAHSDTAAGATVYLETPDSARAAAGASDGVTHLEHWAIVAPSSWGRRLERGSSPTSAPGRACGITSTAAGWSSGWAVAASVTLAAALPLPTTIVALFVMLPVVDMAPTCPHCQDTQGTPGHVESACPLVTVPEANAVVINAAPGSSSSSDPLTWGQALPVSFYNHCNQATLTRIRRLAQRRPASMLTVATMTAQKVFRAATEQTISMADAVARLGELYDDATEAPVLSKIKGYLDILGNMKKAGGIDPEQVVTGAYCGPLRFIYTLAVRIAEAGHVGPVLLPTTATSNAGLDGSHVPLPTTETKFHESLLNMTMLVSTLAVCSVMVWCKFVLEVVYRQLQEGMPWRVVAKVLERYLQLMDTVTTYHPGNVVEAHGGSDQIEREARRRLSEVSFSDGSEQLPPGSGATGGGGRQPTTGVVIEFNGQFSKNPKCKACPIFNSLNPNAKHGKKQLNEHGVCRFRHVCNHWIKGHGPYAICGRDHCRRSCDHPDKCDEPEK